MKNRNSRKWLLVKIKILFILSIALVLISLFSEKIVLHSPTEISAVNINEPPSKKYPFGTDRYGRCVLSRVIVGSKTSIFSSFVLVAIMFIVGTALGILSGYYSGILDTVIMRICDIFLGFPQMVLAIAVAGILGGGLINAMLSIGITGWTLYARHSRSLVLAVKKEPFVIYAKLSGCSDFKIIFKHILPNIISSTAINAASQVGDVLMALAGLSFLGIGVMLPQSEWGSMINEARAYIQLAPFAVLGPALAILLTVILFNYLAEMLRDYMDISIQ